MPPNKIDQEKALTNILDNIPVGIGIYALGDSSFEHRYVNQNMYSILRCTPEEYQKEIQDFGLSRFTSEKSLLVMKQQMEESLSKKISREYTLRCRRYDGTFCWLRVRGHAYSSALPGDKPLCYATFVDVSEERETELKLKAQSERAKLLIRKSKMMTFYYDAASDTMVSDIYNPPQKKFIHYEVKNYLKNLPNSKIIHPDSLKEFLNTMHEVANQPKEREIEFQADFYSTGYCWFRALCISVPDESGNVFQIVGTISDISQEKRAEKEKFFADERFGVAIRNSYNRVFEVDVHTKEVSLLFLTEHGLQKKLISTNVDDFFKTVLSKEVHPEDLPAVAGAFKKINDFLSKKTSESPTYQEYRHLEGNGKYKWYSCSIQFLMLNSPDQAKVLYYIKDIDLTKQNQLKIEEALNEALQKAQSANSAKSDFLARMSHDMRTPMNAILGMTSIANTYTENPSKIKECLGDIESSTRLLLSLINDILDMSKIEVGKMELRKEAVQTELFFKNLLNLIKPQADLKSIRLETDIDKGIEEYLSFDPIRLNQILMNLLSNALKFTKSVDGYVRFSAKQLQKENGIARLQIQVQDNGIGISKNFKKHLFNPFEQDTNNVVRKNIGSGLGLSITQSLVKLMGGTISVESEEGNGSTFTVQIPFAIAQEPEKKFTPIQNISDEFQFNREKILLVEDNELNAKIATMLLEMKNLQVERASNGRIAFEKFKENPDNYYDLVLMDIRMPVMGGIDATRAIRSFPKKYAREIPIIAMSAEVFEEDVKRSIEAGMNAHLAKPIDVRTLYGTLAKFLKGYEK